MRPKSLFLKIAVPCVFILLMGAFVAYSGGFFDRPERPVPVKRAQPVAQPEIPDSLPAKDTTGTPEIPETAQKVVSQPGRVQVRQAEKEDTGLAVAPVSVESDTQRQLFMPSSKSLIGPIKVDFKVKRETFMHSSKSMPVKDVFTQPNKPLDPLHPQQQKKPLKKSTVR